MFACDVMWSNVYLSIYLSNYLTIELATDFSLYLDTNLQSPACLWIEEWRLKIPQKLFPQVFNPPNLRGGLTIRRKNPVESSIWRGKGFHPSTHSIPFHPSVRPSILSIHPYCPSIHPSFPFIYISIYLAICSPICLSTYISTNLSSYLSFDPSIYLIILCNPWVACGLKIQERTIFSPKKGTEGTDNKKHWEASKPTIKQNCTGFDTY